MTRDVERRLAALEAGAARSATDAEAAEFRAALEGMSSEELHELAGECLALHGVDRDTAREVYEESYRLGARRGDLWTELAEGADEVFALYMAAVRRHAERGGASAEVVARLDEHAFRHKALAVAGGIFGGSAGYYYEDGFAWVLMELAAGTPEERITHDAYYVDKAYRRFWLDGRRQAGAGAAP